MGFRNSEGLKISMERWFELHVISTRALNDVAAGKPKGCSCKKGPGPLYCTVLRGGKVGLDAQVTGLRGM